MTHSLNMLENSLQQHSQQVLLMLALAQALVLKRGPRRLGCRHGTGAMGASSTGVPWSHSLVAMVHYRKHDCVDGCSYSARTTVKPPRETGKSSATPRPRSPGEYQHRCSMALCGLRCLFLQMSPCILTLRRESYSRNDRRQNFSGGRSA